MSRRRHLASPSRGRRYFRRQSTTSVVVGAYLFLSGVFGIGACAGSEGASRGAETTGKKSSNSENGGQPSGDEKHCRKVRTIYRLPIDDLASSVDYTYDGRGNLVRETGTSRSSPDGDPYKIITHDYDDRDRRVRTERDFDPENDNGPDEIVTVGYEEGRRTSRRLDVEPDGSVDNIRTYHYGTDGFLVRVDFDGGYREYETAPKMNREDPDHHSWNHERPDGEVDWFTRYQRNEEGLKLREEVHKKPNSDETDSFATKTTTYKYDGSGRMIRKEIDNDADGELDSYDRIVTFEYDDAGRRTRKKTIRIEEREVRGSMGGVIYRETKRHTQGIETYDYDDRGNLIRVAGYPPCSGFNTCDPEETKTHRWKCP